MTKLTDWSGGNGLRYAFDPGGRLTTLTDYNDQTLTYAYDASENVTSMTDWHGKSEIRDRLRIRVE